MYKSPFIYGNTVSNDSFTNRHKETEKLYTNLTSGINTMIISPRRWGKSSLVEKVINSIRKKEKNIKTVVIDLFSISSEEEFLEMFASEVIKASSTKLEDWVKTGKTLFKQLIPKISLGIDPSNDFSLSFNWTELKKHSEEILNLPETIAEKKNLKIIIALDEFQNIATFNGFEVFEKKLRANWQRQKNVTYCLYGSKRHMMSDIFNNPSKPFYRFGDIVLLEKISTGDWIRFITNRYQKTGKKISKLNAKIITDLMKNNSWYVQQLSHYTWQKTDKKATIIEINNALRELIYANTPFYQKEVESISKTQVNLLKAIIKNETKFTSTSVMNKYHLGTPRNVSKNKVILEKLDLVHKFNGKYEFLDPAFELWFLKQFYNKDYAI